MKTRLRATLAGAVLTLLGVVGCAPPGEPAGSDRPSAPSAGQVQTDASELGRATLVVWDQLVRGGQDAYISQLNAGFEKQYPNIDITRVSRSFEDLRRTLRLALSGNQPPDVVQANNGRADMGAFVEADLLLPLNSYAEEYGWTDRYPESVLQYSRYSADGVTFGEGNLYGMPTEGEVVGVFYNRAKLTELGIGVPKTWAEFEAALRRAESAGEVPVQFGNLDQWPGIHEFGTVQGRYVDPAAISDLAFGRPGASWTTPENAAAADALTGWVADGFFPAGFNGLSYDKSWQNFADGEGVFLISGTWLLADLEAALGDDLGFMLPPPRPGGPLVATGGTGLPFAITADSDEPDAAAAYIDYITSEQAMQVVAENGSLPAVDAAEQPVTSHPQQDVFTAWGRATSQDALVPYLDYATPTFYDTLTVAVQDLLANRIDSAEFLQTLQEDYAAFTGEG